MLLNPADRPAWSRHVIAVIVFALAAAVRVWLLGSLGTRAPFITFYPAVILAALGGFPAGLLVTALSALTVSFVWMEPVGQFSLRDPADLLAVSVFLIASAAISWFVPAMQRAAARAAAAEAEVKLTLERNRVVEGLHRYQLLAEHSRDIILHMQRDDGRILEANAAATKAYGYSGSELQSLSIHDLRADDTHRLTESQMTEADLSGLMFETMHRRKDGSTFPVEVSSQGGTIDGTRTLISVIRDITVRRRAEESLRVSEAALRESEARYRRLVDLAPEALLVQQDGQIVYCNQAAVRLYGAESSLSLMGTRLFDRVHPSDLPLVLERIRDAERGTRLPVREARHLRMDGSEVAVETTAGPVEWQGRPAMLVFVSDITARKRAEAHLRDAQKLESLGLLAGGVAHDFNNLLVGVIGNASLAQDMIARDHPAAELLEGVVKAGEEAAHLTRQMLAYSGKGRFVVEPLCLSALLPAMSGFVRPSISKKIELRFELGPDLPAIQADRGQVQQVFMNLVLNAAEAIGSREGLITVRTFVRDGAPPLTGEYVCLEVRDMGCGMDEAIKDKIFDPFFSTKFVGRGLGLAAVAGIVRGHNGTIEVTSAPGEGSSFTVVFPATSRAAAESPGVVRNTALQGAGTILVVDDEPMVREMVKRGLECHGYTVLLANGGLEAIDQFKRHPGEIALVILDLTMPHMNGEEALPELRKVRPAVKVVVSSGYSESEAMSLFKGQQVSGFIQKPYTSKGIAEKVKACLG